jgi:hypothetical protein
MVDGRKCDLFITASNILCVINFVEHCTNKTPRSAEKKTYLQRYLIFLYPELQVERKWKNDSLCGSGMSKKVSVLLEELLLAELLMTLNSLNFK